MIIATLMLILSPLWLPIYAVLLSYEVAKFMVTATKEFL